MIFGILLPEQSSAVQAIARIRIGSFNSVGWNGQLQKIATFRGSEINPQPFILGQCVAPITFSTAL